jgi:hypothetical protein
MGLCCSQKQWTIKLLPTIFCCATSVDLRAIPGEVPLSADNKTKIIPWCRALIIFNTCVD